MKLYSTLARPLLFRLSPEVAHHLTITSLRIPLVSRLLSLGQRTPSDPVHLMNLSFRNRLGIAAGLDKNAEAPLAWRNLGFGFAELGTVTLHPQPGNPSPRVFRYPSQQALINRLGFPNIGAEAIATRLRKLRGSHALHDFPIGINLGKSKVTPLDQAPLDYLGSLNFSNTLETSLSLTSALPTPQAFAILLSQTIFAAFSPLFRILTAPAQSQNLFS